jgi:hypothetical protein
VAAPPAGSVWLPLLASSPHSALPSCEESQEHGEYFGRKAGYLLAWALDLQALGAVVIPGNREWSRVLEPSDLEEFLLAQFAPEHFRSATAWVQVSPWWSVFHPVLAERQESRKVSLRAKRFRGLSFQAG